MPSRWRRTRAATSFIGSTLLRMTQVHQCASMVRTRVCRAISASRSPAAKNADNCRDDGDILVTIINKSALVPYRAGEMYALVDDIAAYPQFLPWCIDARELSRDADEVRAVIELARGGVQKAFTTCNRLQKNKMIEIRLIEGPFRHLEGFWRFAALAPESCKVSLDMDFEFSNKLVGLIFGPVFNQITHALVDAFCKRAQQVYGKR